MAELDTSLYPKPPSGGGQQDLLGVANQAVGFAHGVMQNQLMSQELEARKALGGLFQKYQKPDGTLDVQGALNHGLVDPVISRNPRVLTEGLQAAGVGEQAIAGSLANAKEKWDNASAAMAAIRTDAIQRATAKLLRNPRNVGPDGNLRPDINPEDYAEVNHGDMLRALSTRMSGANGYTSQDIARMASVLEFDPHSQQYKTDHDSMHKNYQRIVQHNITAIGGSRAAELLAPEPQTLDTGGQISTRAPSRLAPRATGGTVGPSYEKGPTPELMNAPRQDTDPLTGATTTQPAYNKGLYGGRGTPMRAGGDGAGASSGPLSAPTGGAAAPPSAGGGYMPGITTPPTATPFGGTTTGIGIRGKALDDVTDYRQTLQQRTLMADQFQDLLAETRALTAPGHFTPRPGAELRNRIALWLEGVGASRELINRVQGGDVGDAVALKKIAVMAATGAATQMIRGSGNQMYQGEWAKFQSVWPNIETDPKGFDKMIKFMDYLTKMTKEESGAFSNRWDAVTRKGEKYDLTQFQNDWNTKLAPAIRDRVFGGFWPRKGGKEESR